MIIDPTDIEEAAAEAIERLRRTGVDEDVAIDTIAAFLDDAIDLEAIVPAPWGALAEAHDGDAWAAVLTWLRGVVRVDPERRQWRQEIRAIRDELMEGGLKRRAATRRARKHHPKPWKE